ncbi:UilS family quorum-quenching N-acyl-homoserine lactonase [Vibrio europaeus]|uniref:UilS family quorum-quenching N-acyl-homoserine lactonase n=1 Tax=Vibrio europaeus TaxID=300876 RepID=UPI00148E6CE9|nr:alpha/beta fold hydrolase [Vibrio europaeus]MDC5811319.1 alpha/beta hydrolase [Vibrio europaeus]MDC5818988.1 alpha/beta hydrolase [Vibrio europaeus]MDC5849566.1 alpha/beta hydrolase [Vibrio europaeus]MDC5870988.1 alpha/beta hydrolase [Vibrio europaeus]NOH21570.1 alpha/beta hydrolase [Vibrio europaeus]
MYQQVKFTSQNSQISGHLYLPTATTQPSPLVILCHGFCGVKELLLPAFAERFANQGYAALTFDYRGFGESEGETGRLVPKLQIEDIHAAIEWAKTESNVDSNRIALWGSSFGGANAIIAASQSDDIKCVIAQLTFADGETVITGEMSAEEKDKFLSTLERMRDKKAKTGKEMMVPIAKVLSDQQSVDFFNQFKDDFPALTIKIPFLTVWETINHKPVEALANLNKPVMIVAAEQDGVNPLSESQVLFDKANEPKALHVEEGATHYQVYSGKHFESVVTKQLEWFNQYL